MSAVSSWGKLAQTHPLAARAALAAGVGALGTVAGSAVGYAADRTQASPSGSSLAPAAVAGGFVGVAAGIGGPEIVRLGTLFASRDAAGMRRAGEAEAKAPAAVPPEPRRGAAADEAEDDDDAASLDSELDDAAAHAARGRDAHVDHDGDRDAHVDHDHDDRDPAGDGGSDVDDC